MGKRSLKPGNMLYPVPAALISCRDPEGRSNLVTVAWCGTVCSDPPMISISLRKDRFSHDMIRRSGEFVVNLTNEQILKQTDLCGVKSGREVDKWTLSGLHEEAAFAVKAPLVRESPVSIECRVRQILELGSHDMFIGEVVSVDADEKYFDEKDRLCLEKCGLVSYVHGEYRETGKLLGTFGYSVRKKTAVPRGREKAAESQNRKKPAARKDGKIPSEPQDGKKAAELKAGKKTEGSRTREKKEGAGNGRKETVLTEKRKRRDKKKENR
ncbi:MAG: flavin reductase family protein [Lachnospiraceae bacterium]|nr:flavin reductase family protein [Lachnospiraceae bacterium]